MNVLVFSVDALPKIGGISTMAHFICNALARRGCKVTFLGPTGTFVPSGFERNYAVLEDWDAEPRKREGEPGRVHDQRIQSLFEKMIRAESIDLVLGLHPFYYGVGAIRAAREHRVPVYMYFHGFEYKSQFVTQPAKVTPELLAAPVSLRDKTVFCAAMPDLVLTNSDYTRTLISDVRPDRSMSTGCGVPASLLKQSGTSQFVNAEKLAAKVATRRGARAGAIHLCFVGRLIANKRADRLVRLAHLSPRFTATIIGDGPERARLAELAGELQVQDRVRIVGQVDDTSKLQILADSDFTMLLSEIDEKTGQVEGFGISLVEGMANCSVPVTSGIGGTIDVVPSTEFGVVGRMPDEALASAILALADDNARYLAVVKRNLQRVLEVFNWDAIATNILSARPKP